MRFSFSSLLSLLVAVSLTACGGSKPLMQTKSDPTPEWFTNLPQDPNFLYAARTAVSRDLGIAIEKATTRARAEVARQYQTKVDAMTKDFQEEIGAGEDSELSQMFTQIIRTVVSTQLSGSRATKTAYMRDGGNYRAFVLVEYPIGAANRAFMQNLQKSRNTYMRFRASEAFKEMDAEVDKYESLKRRQEANRSGR